MHKKRVVGDAGAVRHGQRRAVGDLVAGTHDKAVQRQLRNSRGFAATSALDDLPRVAVLLAARLLE